MIEQIWGIVGKCNAHENYSLKKCSSFGIGGKARFFATPDSIDSLFNLISFAEREVINYRIIGNATNILFGDLGFDGLIISTRKICSIALIEDDSILASAGASLYSVMTLAKSNKLSGFEFAVGIPGSVGGAIVMNAGAGDGEISQIINSVTVLEGGEVKTFGVEELEFGYRTSYFKTHKAAIILFAEFKLKKESNIQSIEEKMTNNLKRRRETQPQERSAGCVFKKNNDVPAGFLIDEAGLKGIVIGDAKISEIHGNFIVNMGDAKAEDVKKLIKLIKTEIWSKYKKDLELEIEIIE